MQPSVSSGSGNLKSVNAAPSAPPHSPSPAIRGGGDMGLRSRQPGGRQPGCTEQPVETALMFLFFVFSSGSWSQGRSKTRSQGFYWFNEVQSKGHWARRVGGETRGLVKVSCGALAAFRVLGSSEEPRRLSDPPRHQTPENQRKAPGFLLGGRIKWPAADPQGQIRKEA